MSNFGFSKLRVVNPYEEGFREARSAVGALSILKAATQHDNVAEAVADCSLVVGTTSGQNRNVGQFLTSLPDAAATLRGHLATGRVAILFGSEKRGLSNEDFAHCHWLLNIPTRDQHASMNLGQSVAVCLYAIATQGVDPRRMPAAELARSVQLEQLTSTMFEMLNASGYVKPRAGASSNDKLRRLMHRLHLTEKDAELLLGMLNKIAWKLGRHANR